MLVTRQFNGNSCKSQFFLVEILEILLTFCKKKKKQQPCNRNAIHNKQECKQQVLELDSLFKKTSLLLFVFDPTEVCLHAEIICRYTLSIPIQATLRQLW